MSLLGSITTSVSTLGNQLGITSGDPSAATLTPVNVLSSQVEGINVVNNVDFTNINGIAVQNAGSSNITNLDGSNTVPELVVTAPSTKTAPSTSTDMPVRLRPQQGQAATVYGDTSSILTILNDTNGLVFPYTPSISVSQDVDYKTIDLVHSNYDINAYTRTPSVSIQVTGKFTVQNKREGKYAIAVLHFLRTVSKMYFGTLDKDKAGTPPPVLLFSGYGTYMFNDLRVVVKSHSYTFDDTVDMVDISLDDGTTTRLPALFTISLTLGVQQTPTAMRDKFSLDQFRTGALMRGGGGWI